MKVSLAPAGSSTPTGLTIQLFLEIFLPTSLYHAVRCCRIWDFVSSDLSALRLHVLVDRLTGQQGTADQRQVSGHHFWPSGEPWSIPHPHPGRAPAATEVRPHWFCSALAQDSKQTGGSSFGHITEQPIRTRWQPHQGLLQVQDRQWCLSPPPKVAPTPQPSLGSVSLCSG